MKWLVQEIAAPLARRVGGQAGAAAVALGVAQEHEAAVSLVVAWGVFTATELAMSKADRKKAINAARSAWGRN